MLLWGMRVKTPQIMAFRNVTGFATSHAADKLNPPREDYLSSRKV